LLQDKVPETIADLMSANIRLWVLTGDKQETAIEIAKSCNLINEREMELVIFSSKNKEEFTHKLTHYLLAPPKKPKMSLVIDGSTLSFVLEDEYLAKAFFQYGCKANSVICCRVSPKQKSDVVALAKNNGPWVTLAIGDGANDVSMIMEAHIGIGIRGKEGSQAARTADYSIGQFKFLKVLLFTHGRWGYRRISLFICYYFYKNVILVFCELYFAFLNGYSGQIFFTDYLPMLYNAIFTSWPCIVTFVFERDCNHHYSLTIPKLYEAGQKKYYFNYTEFWKWIFLALFHGAVAYFIPMYGLYGPTDATGRTLEHWTITTTSFSIILHVVTYKLFVDTYFWIKFNIALTFVSILIYYFVVILGSVPALANLVQPEAANVFFILAANPRFWIMILVVPFICLLPDFGIIIIKRMYFKNPSDVVAQMEREELRGIKNAMKKGNKNKGTAIAAKDISNTVKIMVNPKDKALKIEDWLKGPEADSKHKLNESDFIDPNHEDSGMIFDNSMENRDISPKKKTGENLLQYRSSVDEATTNEYNDSGIQKYKSKSQKLQMSKIAELSKSDLILYIIAEKLSKKEKKHKKDKKKKHHKDAKNRDESDLKIDVEEENKDRKHKKDKKKRHKSSKHDQ
jgi:magnesium-transporting ATPase (P-type)